MWPTSGTDQQESAKKFTKIVLIGGFVCMGLAGWFVMGHLQDLNHAREEADEFIELVLAHDYDRAEVRMCPVGRPTDNQWDELDAYLRAREGSEPFTYTWLSTRRGTGDDEITRIRYAVAGTQGDFTLEVRMIEDEEDGWQPCGIGGVENP